MTRNVFKWKGSVPLEAMVVRVLFLHVVVVQHGQYTVDFCTMYTSFGLGHIISRASCGKSWPYQFSLTVTNCSFTPQPLKLGIISWSMLGESVTLPEVAEMLNFLLHRSFTCNDMRVRRQITGMLMGNSAAHTRAAYDSVRQRILASLSHYPLPR